MELAERIMEYRVINNLKQTEMAKKLGVSINAICNIENGKEVSLKIRTKVKIKLDELESEKI